MGPSVSPEDGIPKRSVSSFLVAASSGLGEEALAGESSEAAAGDVDGCLVGGHVITKFVRPGRGRVLLDVKVDQRLGDVHAASPMDRFLETLFDQHFLQAHPASLGGL